MITRFNCCYDAYTCDETIFRFKDTGRLLHRDKTRFFFINQQNSKTSHEDTNPNKIQIKKRDIGQFDSTQFLCMTNHVYMYKGVNYIFNHTTKVQCRRFFNLPLTNYLSRSFHWKKNIKRYTETEEFSSFQY